MKKILKKILGDTALGVIDYFRFPERAPAWGGPFNGQKGRKEIFFDIVSHAKPCAIIETGTYLGTTAECFANVGLPVFSIEGISRNYGYAKARLRSFKNIFLYRGDSREKLSSLFQEELSDKKSECLFFYLDAHWYEDLPLREEMEIIFGNCSSAIVMVDDFQVPDDSGYTYDDYGNGNSLDLYYLGGAIARHGLAVYFPEVSSDQETGMKRGSVVICKGGSSQEGVLNALKSLRRYGGD